MFNPLKPFSTFKEDKINGFDVMMMQSDRNAEEMITILKFWKEEGRYFINGNEVVEQLFLDYPEEMKDLISLHVKRVREVANKYFDK